MRHEKPMHFRIGLAGETLTSTIHPSLEGVGMIRAEYLCRAREEYVTLPSCREHIASYVRNICKVFAPDEVWYRTSEFVTPEINVLAGVDYVIEEKHYMYGTRGIRRGLEFPETFKLELENIARVADECRNLHVLFPYVGDPAELRKCIKILIDTGFKGKYGMMAEIPSTVMLIDEFMDLGVKNITIGLNDLSALMLGTYRGSKFDDHMHPAVLRAVERIVKVSHDNGVPVSVGGYNSKEIQQICNDLEVDWFIVHYSMLPDILGVESSLLPQMNLLKEIKNLTKSRIAQPKVHSLL